MHDIDTALQKLDLQIQVLHQQASLHTGTGTGTSASGGGGGGSSSGAGNQSNMILKQVMHEQILFAERSRESLVQTREALIRHDNEVREFRKQEGHRPWWTRTLEQQHKRERVQSTQQGHGQEQETLHDNDNNNNNNNNNNKNNTNNTTTTTNSNVTTSTLPFVPLCNSRVGPSDGFGDPMSAALMNEVLEWARHTTTTGKTELATVKANANANAAPARTFFGTSGSRSRQSVVEAFDEALVEWWRNKMAWKEVDEVAPQEKVGLLRFLQAADQRLHNNNTTTSKTLSASASASASAKPRELLTSLAREIWNSSSDAAFRAFPRSGKLAELLQSSGKGKGKAKSVEVEDEDGDWEVHEQLGDFVPWAIVVLGVVGYFDKGEGEGQTDNAPNTNTMNGIEHPLERQHHNRSSSGSGSGAGAGSGSGSEARVQAAIAAARNAAASGGSGSGGKAFLSGLRSCPDLAEDIVRAVSGIYIHVQSASVSECNNLHKCTNAQMHKCSNAQMHKYMPSVCKNCT